MQKHWLKIAKTVLIEKIVDINAEDMYTETALRAY
jgi:hypothetical protein